MKIYKLSASNIGTFKDCPFKYMMKYDKRTKEVQPPNQWGPPGSAFHEAAANYFKKHQDGKPIDPKEFTDLLAEAFTKFGVGLDVYNEWIGIAKAWIKRVRPPKNIIGIEMQIDMILPNGVPIIGYLDLVEEVNESTILIRDWKTGNNPLSDDELSENIQAPMYVLGAKKLFPKKNIEFVFDYIKFNEIPYSYTVNDMKRFIKYLKGTFDAIKNIDPKEAESRIGGHCMFCGYPSVCPSLEEARKGKLEIQITDPKSFDEKIDALTYIDSMLKGLDNEKKRLRALITERMKSESLEEYENESAKVKMQKMTYTNYNVPQILHYAKEHPELEIAIEIKKGVLEKQLNIVPEHVKDDIESSTTSGFSKPFIKVTTKGGKNGKQKKKGNDQFF